MMLSLLHPLLAGVALAAISLPIIIHLLLRQRPKTVIFPALLLLRPKQVQTIRRLKLRHWLLLLIRCALLALFGLALARPTLRSSLLSIDQEAPIAAAFIIDDSPSMSLSQRGESRIQNAKRIALDAANRLPPESQIVIFSTSDAAGRSLAPVAVARQQIEGWEQSSERGSLADALASGLQVLADATLPRREVYIFTDAYRHSWNLAGDTRLPELWKKAGPDTSVFVVGVRAESPENVSIESARPAPSSATPNEPIEIETLLRSNGKEIDSVVRLIIDGEARGEQSARLPATQGVSLRFSLAGLDEGFHQGEVRLAADDALPIDNTRYFSIDVRSPPGLLIISDEPADALYFRKAIEPLPAPTKSNVREIRTYDWLNADLTNVDVIALLNVGQLDQPGWAKIVDFVARGGGLFVALGAHATVEGYNAPAPQEILPIRLDSIHEQPPTHLSVGEKPHPLISRFNNWGQTDFADGAILRYWKTTLTRGAVTILRYADGEPALIEATAARTRAGRVLVLTTPTHYQAEPIWNELPLRWSFVVLAEEIVRYLAGVGEVQLGFEAGDNVEIPRRPGDPFTVYAIKDPTGLLERLAIDPQEPSLTIPNVRVVGQYTLTAAAPPKQLATGFSVNISPIESQLEPIPDDEILATLPAERSSLVQDATDLQRAEGTTRIGQELFPWLVLLVVALLFAETFFSNRFYRQKESATSPAPLPPKRPPSR
jgi:hypothetical protein